MDAAGLAVAVQPVSGLRLGALARETGGGDWRTTWSVGVTFDAFGVSALPAYDENGDPAGTTWLYETAPPRAPLPESLIPTLDRGPGRVAALNLEHKVITYQKYRWFDDRRVAWLDLLGTLDAVRDDPDLDGLAVNLAGTSGRPRCSGSCGRSCRRSATAARRCSSTSTAPACCCTRWPRWPTVWPSTRRAAWCCRASS